MLRFDFGSDLHVDFYGGAKSLDWAALKAGTRKDDLHKMWITGQFGEDAEEPDQSVPEIDTIVIVGDAANDVREVADTLKEITPHYKNVLYVDGNHDHYNTHSQKMGIPRTVADNMQFLHDKSLEDGWKFLPTGDVIIEDTVFIGVNGWYDWNAGQGKNYDTYKWAWKNYMADSRYIKFNSAVIDGSAGVKEPDILAKEDADTLREKVKKYESDDNIKHIVVVTHTIPISKAITVKSKDEIWNALNGSFLNSHMKDAYKDHTKIRYWLFGHTHFSHDIVHSNIRFLCNPKGYPTEITSFLWKPNTLTVK